MLPATSSPSDVPSPDLGRIARRHRNEAVASTVAALIGARLDVPECALRSPERGPRRLTRARRIAIYLAHVAAGLSVTGAAAGFARSRASAIDACQRIETERERDRELDRLLDDMAEAISAALSR